MRKKADTKSSVWRAYVLPLIIILFAFIIAGYFIIKTINVYLYKHMEQDALERAEIHTTKLTSSILAKNIIDQLIADKLSIAGNVILENQDNIDAAFVKDIAMDFKLADVHWYNKDGVIVYTNDKYLGWQAPVGHPVHTFMNYDDRDFWIEEIRKDVSSEEYYKYAYIRGKDGEIAQISIWAEDIYELTSEFCPQKFIDDLMTQDDIIDAYFLDKSYSLIICDSYNGENAQRQSYLPNAQEQAAINSNKIYYAHTNHKGKPAYESIFPIYVEDEKYGTLIMFHSFDEGEALVRNVTLIVLALLVYTFIVYSIMKTNLTRRTKQIEKLAYYDRVTGLPNNRLFTEVLSQQLSKHAGKKRALLIIHYANLNLIKLISGQEVLDDLMEKKAEVLKSILSKEEALFRYAEDTFCISIEEELDRVQLAAKCERIMQALYSVNNSSDSSKLATKRIGVLELETEDTNVSDIQNFIEISINKIQKLEDQSYWFFDRAIQRELILDEMIENELRKVAYDGYDKEFYLAYQPQVCLHTDKIVAFEALARWNNPELGLISPLKFIEIAEKSHLIISLGEWIMARACEFIGKLESQGLEDFKVAINISCVQILEEGFHEKISSIIAKTGIQPKHIELEVTETHFITNYDMINEKLSILRDMGISIALDDFGIGYSSLSRLKRLNIDMLKIDKSFVDNIDKEDTEDMFINSIIVLARQLEVRTVAEGVETTLQMQYLKELGCDIMQGYLFSKPVSEEQALVFAKDMGE